MRSNVLLAGLVVSGVWLLGLAPARAASCNPTCGGSMCDPITKKPPCNRTPTDYQVTLFEDSNYGGDCITFEVGPSKREVGASNLEDYGFDACVSSVKVGRYARLKAYQSDKFQQAYYEQGPFGSSIERRYRVATYEAGEYYATDANDSFRSVVVSYVAGVHGREPIPNIYLGNHPSDGGSPWAMEAQGFAHDKKSWYITNEDYLPGHYAQSSQSDRCAYVGQNSGGSYYCFDSEVPLSNEFKGCLASSSGLRLTGRIYKVPLGEDLAKIKAPSGPSDRERIIRKQWELGTAHGLPNSDLGYRHFGDPDVLVADGKTYVFIPVQGCESSTRHPLPYVLVLDSDLNYYAHLTLPPTPGFENDSKHDPRHKGEGSWVAVRPGSTPSSLELWMSRDLKDGDGIDVFQGELRPYGQELRPLQTAPRLSRYPYQSSTNYTWDKIQGGVFSPSGKTLYLSRGNADDQGGIHVFDADGGFELAISGDAYGYFDFEQVTGFPYYQEPEGLDFLDTRCLPVTIPGVSASQLHAVLLNNHLENPDDTVWFKHYRYGNQSVQPTCDITWSHWYQGFVGNTAVAYPHGFQVFAFGDVVGLHDSEGPIAAQGMVTLDAFSVNRNRVQPLGIVTRVGVKLSNGTVGGGIVYEQGYNNDIPTTVGYDANLKEQASLFSFDIAQLRLYDMSRELKTRTPNGTVTPSNSSLYLTGSNAKLNVFSVSAEVLRQSRSISITVPATSTVLINVSGTDVQMGNAGLTLNGPTSEHILWNFTDAVTLAISSMYVRGSILAPNAALVMNWGNLEGTIVAKSVNATAELYFKPFQFSGLDP